MFRKIILGIAILSLFLACEQESPDPFEKLTFDEKLRALPDLTVTEITPQNGFPRQFEIYITQPLDHDNPDGIRFNQQIFLSHRDESAPVVFMPSGYATRAATTAELSELLNANQIYAGHRFMGNSRPEVMEWSYLTVEQGASDFHHIVELFKKIYKGKWVSFGASKNGCTALFHRRFYPDDVDATLAQVAPISFAVEDPRYDVFLENVGDQMIRDKIKYLNLKRSNTHFHSGSMVFMILPQCRIPVRLLNNCMILLKAGDIFPIIQTNTSSIWNPIIIRCIPNWVITVLSMIT
jgi:hypothetical protein